MKIYGETYITENFSFYYYVVSILLAFLWPDYVFVGSDIEALCGMSGNYCLLNNKP